MQEHKKYINYIRTNILFMTDENNIIYEIMEYGSI